MLIEADLSFVAASAREPWFFSLLALAATAGKPRRASSYRTRRE
jgi:hypothetical protein